MTTRRTFIRHLGAAACMPLVMGPLVRAASPNGKLRLAGIGVGGKGWGDIELTSKGQIVAAMCDIDQRTLDKSAARFGHEVRKYNDWRELLAHAEDVDACTVSTPDHMHAPIALSAMRAGKHVYVQKPLTFSVHEARVLGAAAKQHGVMTQMGTQGHSSTDVRLSVALMRQKAVGPIRQVHIWTNRPIWPQGIDRPAGADPVPDFMHWDNWLGVAPARPYKKDVYNPFKWRGWLDFGTGALGDIGCHAFDRYWEGLALTAPTEIWSDGPAPNGETFPSASTVHYLFPGTEYTADTLHLVWYDGGNLPDPQAINRPAGTKLPDNGLVALGPEGDISGHRLNPDSKFKDFQYPKVEADDHYQQWTRACLGQGKTSTPFDTFASPMTEAVLLGNIALRYPGTRLKWDATSMRFTNHDQANHDLKRPYREGWHIEGLG